MNGALIIFALCALTSAVCAFFLLRGYARSQVRLLLWSGLCFTGFFINNLILVINANIARDLSLLTSLPTLVGIGLLLYGLVWEADR